MERKLRFTLRGEASDATTYRHHYCIAIQYFIFFNRENCCVNCIIIDTIMHYFANNRANECGISLVI